MAQARRQRLLVCKSADFRVDYSINPWMKPGASNPQRAVNQWQAMVEAITEAGFAIEVAEFPAGAPQELIWPRDAYILVNSQVVLANYKFPVRQAETPYYKEWFERHDFSAVQAAATMEGGNVIPHGGRYYYGTGWRGERADCEALSRQLGVEFVPLAVTSNDFFHIDLALMALDEDNMFYYPPAFADDAIKILQSQVKNLHELSKAEMDGYCSNSVALGKDVFVQAGNGGFCRRLEALGKTVHEIDVSEFKDIGGGGIHCLTNVLEWETA